jgi:hypothetical protein
MDKLFIWAEGYQSRYVKKKGLPNSVNCILIEPESPYFADVSKDNIVRENKWTTFYPDSSGKMPSEEFALPKEFYLEVNLESIDFDFLPCRDTIIVSEGFLNFLLKLNKNFEYTKITKVVNREREVVSTNKNYFVVRFFKFDDELINFNPEVKKWFLYPNMEIKQGVDKSFFVLYEPNYRGKLIFTEIIKKDIEHLKFLGPDIYSTEKYPFAFKGMPEK